MINKYPENQSGVVMAVTHTKKCRQRSIPDVTSSVQWLPLLIRAREGLGSNLGSDTGYLDIGFLWSSSVLAGKYSKLSLIRCNLGREVIRIKR
jgi:hypothetical protein